MHQKSSYTFKRWVLLSEVWRLRYKGAAVAYLTIRLVLCLERGCMSSWRLLPQLHKYGKRTKLVQDRIGN